MSTHIVITVTNEWGEEETHILTAPHTPIHCDHSRLLPTHKVWTECEDCQFEKTVQEWASRSELFEVIR